MQLKRATPATIGTSLAAATAALLGQSVPRDAVAQELAPWEFDTAALLYGESDGRVRDLSFNALARKEVREDNFLDLTLAVDSLTGASPSGAAPTGEVHTVTSPSGNSTYQIAAGDLPLDTSFHDSRLAASANYELPVTRLTLFNAGLSFSNEYDYLHTGVNMKIARDLNNRNTTLSFGVALANDSIEPVGGAPIPLSVMLGDGTNKRGNETKDVTDYLLGLTQVINRKTIVQFNLGLTQSDGYQNDPYKILSVVDPVFGTPIAAPPDADNIDYLYYYESRPDTREKKSIYGLLKRDVNGDVFDVSYRFMTDDWGVDSHTIDLHYRRNIDADHYVQPHIRLYSQSAASFYQTVLFDGAPLPMFATADYRLSEFTGITLGIKAGMTTRTGELSGRFEIYHQSAKPSPGSQVGQLRRFDINPGFTAIIAQLGYKFGG